MEFVYGVLTGLSVWAIQAFLVKCLLPWCKDQGLNAVKIKGKWNVKYKGGDKDKIVSTLELSQWRTNVRGEAHVTLSRDNGTPDEDRRYVYEGKMLNDSLVLYYDNKKNSCHTGGAMCFYFPDKNNTFLMHGKSIFYANQSVGIDVVEYILEKAP
ncbi:hypothetical protein [Shewanella sp. 0m-4]